jgi:hypothetical protein
MWPAKLVAYDAAKQGIRHRNILFTEADEIDKGYCQDDKRGQREFDRVSLGHFSVLDNRQDRD